MSVRRARLVSAALTLVLGASMTGCGGRSARVRDPGEESLVGERRAGAETYRNLIDGALKDLSDQYRAQTRGQQTFSRIKMSFVGVENATNEELGSWRDQINEIITDRINFSGDFTDVSFDNFVKPVMDEVGVNTRQLVIPAHQRKLATALEQKGSPVDYLLFAKLTQGDTRAGDLKQSDYLLTMQLMNLSNGTFLSARKEISKEYSR
jgi:hypothetical protein